MTLDANDYRDMLLNHETRVELAALQRRQGPQSMLVAFDLPFTLRMRGVASHRAARASAWSLFRACLSTRAFLGLYERGD